MYVAYFFFNLFYFFFLVNAIRCVNITEGLIYSHHLDSSCKRALLVKGMVYPHLRIRTCFWASPTVLLSFYFSLLCPTPTHRHTKMEGHLYISYFSIVSFFVNKKVFDSVFLLFLKKTRNCFALCIFQITNSCFFFPQLCLIKKTNRSSTRYDSKTYRNQIQGGCEFSEEIWIKKNDII